MSKAQTDEIAALRIELDETRRERDEARAQAVDLAKQLEAERHLHDALGSTLRIRSLESERDALTKQVEALSKITRSVDTPALVDAMLKSDGFAKLYGDSIKELEAERDSLRERLGDAERVIETTSLNLCVVADSHHEDARSACRAEIEKALAEFDAKRGKR